MILLRRLRQKKKVVKLFSLYLISVLNLKLGLSCASRVDGHMFTMEIHLYLMINI